jgi:uncharacterized protein YjbI with pentapeptide repeats
MSEQDGRESSTKQRRSRKINITNQQNGKQSHTTQRPVKDDTDAWKEYWKAQGQLWRMEPEIDTERQQYLNQRRSIKPNIEHGIYSFRDIEPKLTRADIEWLLATHENGRGPVYWKDESQRERDGLDLRGADLHQANLSGLPLAQMRGGLKMGLELFDATEEQRNMAAVQLQGANLWGAQLQGAILAAVQLQGAILREAQLQGADLFVGQLQKTDLFGAQLQGADLLGAQLQGADLFAVQLQKAILSDAQLQKVRMFGAQLQEAHFGSALLQGADLGGAQLQGADLSRAQLQGANLCKTNLDQATLDQITFSNQEYGSARLANINWGEVNLAVIDWEHVRELGDEQVAHEEKDSEGKRKVKQTRIYQYKEAVRANRQLAVVLRDQGLNEEADHFAYHAQLLQRTVWRLQGRELKYILSWFLYLLAGYGYRPLRTLLIYFLLIGGFAFGYYKVTHMLHAQPYPLAWYEALILSLSSFHGRGFFQPVQSLGDPVAVLASIEAVFGLLVEISFIATFTQRFFGK